MGKNTQNANKFLKDMKRFIEKDVREDVNQMKVKKAAAFFLDVVDLTPSKTGRMAAMWFSSIGSPSERKLPPGEYTKPDIQDFLSGVKGVRFGQSIHVTNNHRGVFYREHGTRYQHPTHMVKIALITHETRMQSLPDRLSV
jgi:hypothetical protein